MNHEELKYPEDKALDLDRFREMDFYAVNNYNLPIELMMENAGLHLANLIARFSHKKQLIRVGIGNGNNGGGGLVAARRLAAWGYKEVYLDTSTDITKDLLAVQLKRSLKFGVKNKSITNPDVWVDAYLGFSQRLPLSPKLLHRVAEANHSSSLKISLDIPTGFLGDTDTPFFQADKVLTLAAPKKILYKLNLITELYVADIGIPEEVYSKFESIPLPFHNHNIIKLRR